MQESASDLFRSVLGHFASGVTVVTGGAPDGPAGFSLQSFSSLSLDPPLIVILPGRNSTTWPRIERTGGFCVNVLSADQETLSTRFSVSNADKFAGIAWEPGPAGAPHIAGACAWIDCTIRTIHDGGDHLIVVGAVKLLRAADKPPLLFHRGQYAQLAS